MCIMPATDDGVGDGRHIAEMLLMKGVLLRLFDLALI